MIRSERDNARLQIGEKHFEIDHLREPVCGLPAADNAFRRPSSSKDPSCPATLIPRIPISAAGDESPKNKLFFEIGIGYEITSGADRRDKPETPRHNNSPSSGMALSVGVSAIGSAS